MWTAKGGFGINWLYLPLSVLFRRFGLQPWRRFLFQVAHRGSERFGTRVQKAVQNDG
jgi:hypothetical protein